MSETESLTFQSEDTTKISTVMPALPFDLFEPILSHLGNLPSEKQLIRNSYANIGLVCRAFLPAARRNLFSHIVIGHPIPISETNFLSNMTHPYLSHLENMSIDARRTILAHLMDKNPSIASHIQQISYVVFPQELTCTGDQNEDPDIESFLHLPRIHSLDIKARYRVDYGGCLPSYQESDSNKLGFRRVVEGYLSTGNLTSLAFTRINDIPIGNILSSPSLKSLHLSYCTIIEWTPNESSEHKQPAFRLCDLTLYDMAYSFHHLLPHLVDLQTLRVDYPFQYGGSDRSMRKETDPVSPSWDTPLAFRKLQVLEFVNYRRCPPQWTYFTNRAERNGKACFPGLKKITVDVRSHQYNPFIKSLQSEKVKEIMNLLENSPLLHSFNFVEYNAYPDIIQELDLGGYVNPCRELSFHLPYTDRTSGDAMRSLCRNLKRLQGRNNLERLIFNFDLREPTHASDRDSMLDGPSEELWTTIQDVILGNHSYFPVLQLVQVNVSVIRSSVLCGGVRQWLPKGLSPGELDLVRRGIVDRLWRVEVSSFMSLDVSVYYVEMCEFQG